MADTRDDFIIAIRSALIKKGAKQKFSLFFLIVISTLILFLESFSFPLINFSRSIINDGVYRVSSFASSPIKLGNYLILTTQNHFRTYNENKMLKLELEDYKKLEFEFDYLKIENEVYKKSIGIVTESEISNSEFGKVIIDKNSPYLKSIILNKGSNSGIKKGMPALSGGYLVGRVVEVNYLSSRILLLNDLNSKIPVTFGTDASVQAILAGDGSLTPLLMYLPDQYEPIPGLNVYTSGKDGFFDEGIPIGKTILTDKDVLKTKLFTQTDQLSIIQIKKNKNTKEKEIE